LLAVGLQKENLLSTEKKKNEKKENLVEVACRLSRMRQRKTTKYSIESHLAWGKNC